MYTRSQDLSEGGSPLGASCGHHVCFSHRLTPCGDESGNLQDYSATSGPCVDLTTGSIAPQCAREFTIRKDPSFAFAVYFLVCSLCIGNFTHHPIKP